MNRLLSCKIIPLVVLVGLLFSCTPNAENTMDEVKKEDVISPFSKLAGKWADNTGEYSFYEIWETANAEMNGTGLVMSNGDTVFIEHLGIVLKDSIWHYSARIDNQNNDEDVYFKNTLKDENNWVFENAQHDFPQQIEYQFKDADSLLITISGKPNDSLRVEYFKLRKVNK
jgi:hypothetical protein